MCIHLHFEFSRFSILFFGDHEFCATYFSKTARNFRIVFVYDAAVSLMNKSVLFLTHHCSVALCECWLCLLVHWRLILVMRESSLQFIISGDSLWLFWFWVFLFFVCFLCGLALFVFWFVWFLFDGQLGAADCASSLIWQPGCEVDPVPHEGYATFC